MSATDQFEPDITDQDLIESLDECESREIIAKFAKDRPTLEEALESTGIKNYDKILKKAMNYAREAKGKPEIKGRGLTDDEAGAIACYTFEEKDESLYNVVNEGLAKSRNRVGLSDIGKFLFLLLSGLRKLPRYSLHPGKELYRGIKKEVPQTLESAEGHQYYEEGRIVTWWGFTSTTKKREKAMRFIGKGPGTLFVIGGKDLWGYEPKSLSDFPKEEEVLLEPETKILVREVIKEDNYLRVTAEFQSRPTLVLGNITPLPCMWKDCPGYVDENAKYSVDENNPRIVTNISGNYCTIIENTSLPLNKVTSWSIKILKSRNNDGEDIYIGVAPFGIDQNESLNHKKCGWYFDCWNSTLYSGPPHNYEWPGKKYGQRKGDGKYVHTGDTVGVVMDTTKGELSFVVNGVNYGVAYDGIPLDKPLGSCVILSKQGDSVELDTSEVNENVDSSIGISNIVAKSITWDSITLTWDAVKGTSFYQIEMDGSKFWEVSTINAFAKKPLLPEIEYTFRVRAVKGNSVSKWSDIMKGRTQKKSFESSGWEECPEYVVEDKKYSVDEENPSITTNICGGYSFCTIIGNTPLPLNEVTSWSIKVLKSKENNGGGVFIGVAPYGINQNEEDNYNKSGWYFYCYGSTLWSGFPHNYKRKEYGPRKESGQYVHTGDSVGVVMDTTKGELSFVVNGVDLGVAFEGIPLDKPIVPCVLLKNKGDSVELVSLEVKKSAVGSPIPIPSNITSKSTTWDSITLTWDAVEGASFYQVEVDDSRFWDGSTTNTFTKKGLFPETEHTFRVRVVRGNSVSEWSEVVKGRTQKESFERCGWKECPDDVDGKRQYSVDENNKKVARKIGNGYCTIIGNTPLPLNKVTSWSIKILETKENSGCEIDIGVASSDIDQNESKNYMKCGWYFYCRNSALYSGPPHKYDGNEYGSIEGWKNRVHAGGSVGVIMDTTNGDLSFVVNGVNYGIAYEGIPLDNPLVPCVIIYENDSVELDTSEVKDTVVDNSIHVPSNITTKNGATWDTITLTWDVVEGASFYQIEVNESKFWEASTTNSFTKRGLPPDAEHTFRVRAVREFSVSEWSNVVKERTRKKIFENSGWKDCPNNVESRYKYSVDEYNPRIVKKVFGSGHSVIVGNTPLPLNKVTSWGIKVLKTKENSGCEIDIGVAPSDIEQNDKKNYMKCGWYFYCFDSRLWSGPPHNYSYKTYGPRKGNGEYVHTGDIVGVVMDTSNGELSFVVNGVNLGIAFEGIPLDKPLVPCVIIYFENESVELDLSRAKENLDDSISVPSNFYAMNTTWDIVTLTWDPIDGASFYQLEMNEITHWIKPTKNKFTERNLPADKEYIFRVRAVKENSVGRWSCYVRRGSFKSFEASGWKKFPESVNINAKYSVDEKNTRIATKACVGSHSTIMGTEPLPRNKVTSWSIKILKSKDDNGDGIFIGVAPSEIDRNENENYNKSGWYFYCYGSTLLSGPPHNYKKRYGPWKGWGKYVRTGDSVGVVMDTVKGELSFVVDGMNLGVAFEGIPLDEPLVPCVLLLKDGDSVELDTSEVKENIIRSIPIPSNITAKSITWDSITLTWNEIERVSYQVEIDGITRWLCRSNCYIHKDLRPNIEHSFRVRTVRGNAMSEWSDVVRKKTREESFEASGWKECPDSVDERRKYSIDNVNRRVVSKYNIGVPSFLDGYCTVIGNTLIPLGKLSFWSVKILKTQKNDGNGIFVGVAPSNIDQNQSSNYKKCGWYFYCCDSTLNSGPPHNYGKKVYSTRKEKGVHTEDIVGVMMDTAKGELSFVLNGMNLGVAYEGIPLDKPLVPCVLLGWPDDSIELII